MAQRTPRVVLQKSEPGYPRSREGRRDQGWVGKFKQQGNRREDLSKIGDDGERRRKGRGGYMASCRRGALRFGVSFSRRPLVAGGPFRNCGIGGACFANRTWSSELLRRCKFVRSRSCASVLCVDAVAPSPVASMASHWHEEVVISLSLLVFNHRDVVNVKKHGVGMYMHGSIGSC